MRILLTNDDGIKAKGINILRDFLVNELKHEVIVVAPDNEKSASSHAISLHKPFKIVKYFENEYSVSGTPVDCVLVGLNAIMHNERPDLVISGINHGQNMGEDVFYSGTVGAAFEGAFRNIKSIAISCIQRDNLNFISFLNYLEEIMNLYMKVEDSYLININFSAEFDLKGYKFTKLGKRFYKDELIVMSREGNETCYKIGGEGPFWENDEDADYYAVHNGYISITPLALTLTDNKILDKLERLYG